MKTVRTAIGPLALSSAIGLATFAAAPVQSFAKEPVMLEEIASAPHDFDFLVGRWRVHHRRLKERLTGSTEWVEFEGWSVLHKTMGGYGTFDDNYIGIPGGEYRAMSVRAYDPKDGLWSVWWIDGRTPQASIDPPLRGGFKDGVGLFYSDEVIGGKPVRVRYVWSNITPTSAHWEQAFSPDGGKTWETNWRMELERAE